MLESRNKVVLRPCIVDSVGKSLFHLWEHYSRPIEAGLTIGSHPAGIVSYVVGIVEDINGQIYRVPPEKIRFIDNEVVKELGS